MSDMIIKVPESEHKAILDCEGAAAAVKDLHRWTELVHDLASYGSNLIPRCFVSSARNLEDAVVIAILLRQVVAMIDAVDVLLACGAIHAAQLPMRALFEASVYIDWILQGDSENKARHYYVHNIRRKRLWAARTQSGSADSTRFQTMMTKAGIATTDEMVNAGKQQLEDIDKILAKPALAPISAEFDRLRKAKAHDVNWYVPLGPRNFAAIARAVGKEPYSATLYSLASQVMHSSSYDPHVILGTGELTFQPIRSLDKFPTVLSFSVSLTLGTYRAILQEYRPGELPSFGRKYLEKWQRELVNLPKITVNTESIRI